MVRILSYTNFNTGSVTMKLRLMSIVALGVAASVASFAEAPSLKIYRGDRRTDTVYTARQYVIGVTSPGSVASIDGKDVHVYKTGSFGAEVALKPGENVFDVVVSRDGETTSGKARFVLVERRKAGMTEAEKTSMFARPMTVETLSGAYLQYGNGGDRLGGSKMGFLDEGICMSAVGETSRLYKVVLGGDRTAYLPKEYAKAVSEVPSECNTGSASIFNAGSADRISISLPVRLPYSSVAQIDPSTITVSLYGATNNSNWITQRTSLEAIDFVDFRQEGSDRLDIVIRLKDKYQWGYSVGYEGTNLCIDVRHRPKSLKLSDLTIGLDAGHGGEFPGAISPSGLTEKEVNLDIILKAAELLRAKGAKVVLTREGDTGPSMTERKRIWREGNVDLAVSVHNNSSGNPLTPMGTSAYYKHIQNRALASSLHKSMLTLGVADFGLTGNFNFSLNGPTDYPNALVEVLFMSSLPEEELLADPEYRGKLARKIVEGIENYLSEVRNSH